ncbi:MAG TPA: hypothetical protein VFF31_05845 [Blastocatellia bacterium]|nr:hypothetical protein [Blastocatellia bacterium]
MTGTPSIVPPVPPVSAIKGFAKAIGSSSQRVREEAVLLWAEFGGWRLVESSESPDVRVHLWKLAADREGDPVVRARALDGLVALDARGKTDRLG